MHTFGEKSSFFNLTYGYEGRSKKQVILLVAMLRCYVEVTQICQ